jgi:PST family polysaccharide transporter
LTGIAFALWGAGAWAPVVQQCVASAAGAAVLLAASGWRPSFCWRWRAVRHLLALGLPLTASTLVQIGRYRLFAILIGGTAGAAALGQVHVAFRLVDTVRELSFTALWRLMLPVLARHQQSREAMLHCVDRLLRRSCCVTLPLCAGMALAMAPVVSLVLGPRWVAASQATLPLVALMAVMAVMFPAGVALVAVGQARFTLNTNIAGLLASSAGVLLLRPADPWQAVMVWCASQALISPYALWVNGRALGVGPLRPLTGGIRQPAWGIPR